MDDRALAGSTATEKAWGAETRLSSLSQSYLKARRRFTPGHLDYLILVPTLRCNLSCSYCQVSRVDELALGYDWDDETLAAVIEVVAKLKSPAVKIEFQGGEPTLRPDLIEAVIDAVPAEIDAQFVVCTNLQRIDDHILRIFDRSDVSISTSLDGPSDIHARQRLGGMNKSREFEANLRFVIDRYGAEKVSALPTIDPSAPVDPDQLIEAFTEYGFNSIYLRPINYQGFARKRHANAQDTGDDWSAYHRRFIMRLIERNWHDKSKTLAESYFSLLLHRIFRPGSQRHVDLRNPNPMGHDYVVIDHDGTAYPTDEARMLARSRVIDLSIGDVFTGWDTPQRDALDAASTLDNDPVCKTCAYQPYCGRDIVDDISRYGTIDVPRGDTEFCNRHMALFDLAFELIYSDDVSVRYSLGNWLGLPGPMPTMEIVE